MAGPHFPPRQDSVGTTNDMRSRRRCAILRSAEAACAGRYSPPLEERDADEFYVLGLAALQKGAHASAIASLERALSLVPYEADYLNTLALLLSRRGDVPQAINTALLALQASPRDPRAYSMLGRLLKQSGRLVEAAAAYRWELALDAEPTDICALAEVLYELGRTAEAIHLCEAALTEGHNAEIYSCLGRLQSAQGDHQAADHALEWAFELERDGLVSSAAAWPFEQESPLLRSGPSSFPFDCRLKHSLAAFYQALGETRARANRLKEAVDAFRNALALDGQMISAHRASVLALERMRNLDELDGAWLAFGVALEAQSRLSEAKTAYLQVLSRRPESLAARLGLGRVYANLDEPANAARQFDAAIALAPDYAGAHVEASRICLANGDVERGWDEFRWAYNSQKQNFRAFEQPVWDGSRLEDRTLLIWADQVLGDTIQFLRYVPVARSKGAAHVVLECQTRLLPIVLPHQCGVDVLVARGTPLPHFDVHIPLTLIPALVRECRAMAPLRPPYLDASKTLTARWQERLLATPGRDSRAHSSTDACRGDRETPTPEPRTRRICVGLSWAGHPEGLYGGVRFAPLSTFAPLARLECVRYISLQMGPQTAELLASPPGLQVEQLQDESCTLSDTAALVKSLDLVIAVDTMIAHLAGAMDTPVWLALPFKADWRWGRCVDRSDLYPTMTIFRQPRPGDWTGVFMNMRNALASLLRRPRASQL